MRFISCYLRFTLAVVTAAHAQAVRVDGPPEPVNADTGEARAAEPTKGPATEEQSPPEPKAEPPPVVPPRPLRASVSYPRGGSGDQRVILELIVGQDGSIEQAVAISGEPPFSTHAEQAAAQWLFEPATRGGQKARARIRFLVNFIEPEPEPELELEPQAEPAGEPTSEAEGTEPRERPQVKADAIEVMVVGERKGLRRELTQAEIKQLPGAFGDPFRAIEALPGVVPIMSGVPYFYVRGSPPGNVGYFFDGIPVPVLYHFAAGPGVLHPAFVERVDLYAGAYPARFGRFAGGVVSGAMAPPSHTTRGEASVRIIDSGGMLEVPFDDGRGSVMLGGRYSYTAAVLSLLVPEVTVNYWDYQARVRYDIDDDDSVEIFSFGSGDYVAEEISEGSQTRSQTLVDLGFHRVDLRWNRRFERGEFRQALMLGLDNTQLDEGEVRFINGLVGLRSELTVRASDTLLVRSGADLLFERLEQRLDSDDERETEDIQPAVPRSAPMAPSSTRADETQDDGDDDDDDELGLGFDQQRRDFALGLYTDVVIDVTPDIEVTPGLRSDLFVSGGRAALGIDPRIMARFRISDKLVFTHGLGVAHQTPSFVIPVPGVKPSLEGGLQRALQHSSGVEYELSHGFHSSLVLFQNLFFNMTDLLGLVQLNQADDGDADRFRMTGRGLGAEIMIRRSLARDLGGFVSYTLSRAERASGRLEGPATTDRTHVLNLAASYDLGRNWRFGSRFLVYSGMPAQLAYIQAAKAPPRTTPFWRLDWRLQKRWPSVSGPGYWGLVVEVLNTTLNKEVLEKNCNAFDCVEESIGPVTIPSIGVEAAF